MQREKLATVLSLLFVPQSLYNILMVQKSSSGSGLVWFLFSIKGQDALQLFYNTN